MSIDGASHLGITDVLNVMYHISSIYELSDQQTGFIQNCYDTNNSGNIDMLDSINLLYEIVNTFIF